MDEQQKTASGKLLDMESKAIVSVVSVMVELTQSKSPNGHPKVKVIRATVAGHKPELADKTFLLICNSAIPVEVSISLSPVGFPNMKETQFDMKIQSLRSVVRNWFQSL